MAGRAGAAEHGFTFGAASPAQGSREAPSPSPRTATAIRRLAHNNVSGVASVYQAALVKPLVVGDMASGYNDATSARMAQVVKLPNVLLSLIGMGMLAAGACSGPMYREGPVATICGTNIGRAIGSTARGSGPWYVDASRGAPGSPVTAVAHTSPMHVRVSSDCAHGAVVSVSDPAVIGFSSEIRAADGLQEVISVGPGNVGNATLTIRRAGVKPITVLFQIVGEVTSTTTAAGVFPPVGG